MFFSSVLICALVACAACDPSGDSSYDYDEVTPEPRPRLKQSVTRWIERNPASIKKLVDGGIDAFLDEVGYDESKGPCMVLIYRLGYYRKATMSRCVPTDSRLTRDIVKASISKNVDELEPMNIASLSLLALEVVVGIVFGIIYCARKACGDSRRQRRDEANDPHDPRDFFEMQLRAEARDGDYIVVEDADAAV